MRFMVWWLGVVVHVGAIISAGTAHPAARLAAQFSLTAWALSGVFLALRAVLRFGGRVSLQRAMHSPPLSGTKPGEVKR